MSLSPSKNKIEKLPAMTLESLMLQWRERANQHLDQWLPPVTTLPTRLHEAMRYSVLNGGKRIRPILTYAAGQAVDVTESALDAPACAVELIHAYSLVHDDLPAMDDDTLRRGKPTCHRAFDEATAILTGDALQSLAFHILARYSAETVSGTQRLAMIDLLAMASGSRGMAGGQAIDLAAVGQDLSLPELENMHIHKTGVLIRASVKLGAMCRPDIDPEVLQHLDHYAKCIGLAFQIQDDILDVESDTETLGKTQGTDSARNKPTYPSLLGLEEARQMAHDLHADALASLETLGDNATPLRRLAGYIIQRQN